MTNIEQQILAEFFLPPMFLGFDRNGFMRTKNYFIDVARLDSNDLHTGATLWRKYKEIRFILMSDFAPILSSKLPRGMPPSEKTFAEIILAVRKEVYEKYEDISEKKSKALRGCKRHAFMESWYIVTYGAGVGNICHLWRWISLTFGVPQR